jgi:hypothetical protein
MTHEARLVTFIARCRRRVRLLLLARHLVMALTAVCLVGAGLLVAGAGPAPEWTAAAMMAAITTAAVLALWLTPTRHQIAADVDRRLGLENSVVAALQVGESQIGVAPLVVRAAASRLASVQPSLIFPLDMRRPGITLVSSVLMLAGVLMMGPSPVVSSGTGVVPGMSNEASSAGSDASANGPATTSPAPVGQPSGPANTATTPATRDPGSREAVARIAAGTPGSQPTLEEGNGDRSSVRTRAASPPPALADQRVGRASSGSALGTLDQRGQGLALSGRDGASNGGAGAAGIGSGEGAGGVQQQPASGTALDKSEAVQGRPLTAAQYAQARQRANSVYLRERVPPDLREYVRAYFVGIAPPDRK